MDKALQQQLLAQLQDIKTPEAVSWWPPAVGWWLLFTLLTALFVFLIYWYRKRIAMNQYRVEALHSLDQAFRGWQENSPDNISNSHYLQTVKQLLFRVVRHLDSQDNQSFNNKHWLVRMNHYANQTVSSELDFAFNVDCYQAQPISDIEAINRELKSWLESHRRKADA